MMGAHPGMKGGCVGGGGAGETGRDTLSATWSGGGLQQLLQQPQQPLPGMRGGWETRPMPCQRLGGVGWMVEASDVKIRPMHKVYECVRVPCAS